MGFEAPEKTWLEEIDSDIKNTIQNSPSPFFKMN